ncbi:MAG: hypothetical protein MUD14_28710 [Hydrococcus sp. Prado102]|jgi:hypothetical protein|nr:hypothetical protein [Hydrococcus sp. Prado102]
MQVELQNQSVKKQLNDIETTLLKSYLVHLKGLFERTNNTDKMFALLSAIRGIEEYLEE